MDQFGFPIFQSAVYNDSTEQMPAIANGSVKVATASEDTVSVECTLAVSLAQACSIE
jgi:hypothetical protein